MPLPLDLDGGGGLSSATTTSTVNAPYSHGGKNSGAVWIVAAVAGVVFLLLLVALAKN